MTFKPRYVDLLEALEDIMRKEDEVLVSMNRRWASSKLKAALKMLYGNDCFDDHPN